MIALLSALLGFVSSATPELLKLFRDGKDRAHEITLLQMQMEQAQRLQTVATVEQAAARTERLEAIALEAQQAEAWVLNARLKEQMTGIGWVDGLAGSVRPVLTYGFFLLYVSVKVAQFQVLVEPTLPWREALTQAQALVAVWNEEDVAIFSAIMAFWFGSRIMAKKPRV